VRTAIAAASAAAMAWGTPAAAGAAAASTPTDLQVFYRSPVLVRPGEALHIPVDVVCIRSGSACSATAHVIIAGSRQVASAPAAPGLAFDLRAAASRAASTGRLDYLLGASSGAGDYVSLPGAAGGSLHVYVTSHMPVVQLPAISAGSLRRGTQALFMPWGSGERSAGLSTGEEALTLGPSSFAIGPDGSFHVADVFHQRIAVFHGGRLDASLQLAMSPQTDLAVGAEGQTFIASDFAVGERRTRFTVLDRGGDLESFRTEPASILSQVGTDGTTGYAKFLPLDAWTAFPDAATASGATTGVPLRTGGELLRSLTRNSVRLGIADGRRVHRAVELRSTQQLGDLAYASTDGAGGYVAVVRIVSANAYAVAHIARDRSVTAFAVPARQYAATMPHGQFRLGPDGALYQLTTSPDGARIVRYAMGGTR
jgi:hypothetical protein